MKLSEKMAQFETEMPTENQPKKDTPQKEKGFQEKQKPQAEWKEEKATAPTPEEMMNVSQYWLQSQRLKDPFAHLPKSTFVSHKFKGKYSSEDTLSLVLPYLGEHFDKGGWSSCCHFPEELIQTFGSCILITGMFQQLDTLRKNAFVRVILFETNHSSSISGVWVFYRQELAFSLSID